jgi:hypothetical protein
MDFGEEGDKFTGNRSALILYEDGKPLGPARAVHAQIREHGQGRYSHWTRATLYFSTSDNSDPRVNGRKYRVASANPRSSLGGLDRFPAEAKEHVETINNASHTYEIAMGGTLDMDNTRTLTSNNCYIAFQNNVALVIENVGDTPIVNPRLVINDRGNWYTFDSLLEEFTRGATTEQERAYFIWENMRQNLYHESPLFGDSEPHDPVKLFNVYGFNLCDDAGNAGCSMFYHAGLVGSKNRALNGHVQCEAFVDGAFQFLDVDMDCFYLDRENERPVGGDRCARDHDLVRRELNYGPVVARWTSSDRPAALFGPDDRRYDARLRGHEIAYTLRPGEKAVFRWDNVGKYCADSLERAHRPKYFGNSRFVYTPRLTLAAAERDACALSNIVERPDASPPCLAGNGRNGFLIYDVRVPYAVCGGTVRAMFAGSAAADRFGVSLSLDGRDWKTLWTTRGTGPHQATVVLDEALALFSKPAKYRYFVKIELESADTQRGAALESLEIETDVLAAPASLPRLAVGRNSVVYRDETRGTRQVRITHRWRESNAVRPLPPIDLPDDPPVGGAIRDSIVTFRWPAVDGTDRYHLQVSRRDDFRYPYRTSLDVIIPSLDWTVPYTGIFSPDETYYWRLRCRDQWGVWGPWSEPWTFTWQGPCVPVNLRFLQDDSEITLHWEPNPRGRRPVTYEVYGSDERGFSIHQDPHDVPGRGRVPGNLLGRTSNTSLVVVARHTAASAANRVFYRVVAVDEHGTQSGCSDYVELPHPYIYTRPPSRAAVGECFEYRAASLRSLGDYQGRLDPTASSKQYAYRFWDTEQQTYSLAEAPDWLTVNGQSGIVSGTPAAADVGAATVRLEVTDQFGGRAVQEFNLNVQQASRK